MWFGVILQRSKSSAFLRISAVLAGARVIFEISVNSLRKFLGYIYMWEVQISPPKAAVIDRGPRKAPRMASRITLRAAVNAAVADAKFRYTRWGTQLRLYTHRFTIRSVPDANARSSLSVLLSNRCLFGISSNETYVRAGKARRVVNLWTTSGKYCATFSHTFTCDFERIRALRDLCSPTAWQVLVCRSPNFVLIVLTINC